MDEGIGFPTLIALALVPIVALVVWARGGFDFLHSHPCGPREHGALCVLVSRDNLTVNDVVVYVPLSDPPLAGNTWRLVLTADGQTYPGLTRTNEPVACRDAQGNPDPTRSVCYAPGVEAASQGSFFSFNVPNTFSSATALCVAAEVQTAGTWTEVTAPARSCTSVG